MTQIMELKILQVMILLHLVLIENVTWMNWNEDGKLFCVTAPENSNEGVSSVTLRLEDNRTNSSESTEYEFDLTVIANDAPTFSNITSFPLTNGYRC